MSAPKSAVISGTSRGRTNIVRPLVLSAIHPCSTPGDCVKEAGGQDGGHRTWDGGFTRKDYRRRDVYVIRRQLHGKRYVVSTRAHSLRAALQHLARFEADPEGYRLTGEPHEAPIYPLGRDAGGSPLPAAARGT